MASATSWTFPASSHSSLFVKLPKINTSSHKHIELKLRNKNEGNRSLQCFRSSYFETNSVSEIPTFSGPSLPASLVVSDKLNLLVSEFRSLSEPIDRVKRLLHFATLLPPLEESARVPENRVRGCTTQVWLTAEMDERGRMRFRADSDSEITRGFCWCLIWLLDGAEPEEVMAVEAEDLAAMNVGIHVKARSRVHTWHNVLFSMQKTTETLLLHRVNDQSVLSHVIADMGNTRHVQINTEEEEEEETLNSFTESNCLKIRFIPDPYCSLLPYFMTAIHGIP